MQLPDIVGGGIYDIEVGSSGIVEGFGMIVTAAGLVDFWNALVADRDESLGIHIQSAWQQPSLKDAVMFSVMVAHGWRVGTRQHECMSRVAPQLHDFLHGALRPHVLHRIMPGRLERNRAVVPARRMEVQGPGYSRHSGREQLDPRVVWETLQKARDKKRSPKDVVLMDNDRALSQFRKRTCFNGSLC